jgi:hypothetical protein
MAVNDKPTFPSPVEIICLFWGLPQIAILLANLFLDWPQTPTSASQEVEITGMHHHS